MKFQLKNVVYFSQLIFMGYISYVQHLLLLDLQLQNKNIKLQMLIYDKQLEILTTRLENLEKVVISTHETTPSNSLIEVFVPHFLSKFVLNNPSIGELAIGTMGSVINSVIFFIFYKMFRDGYE